MRLTTELQLILALAADVVFGWTHASEASLRKALRSNDYTLVAFVDSTHDASKSLEPQWIKIQTTERDNNVVSFDCGAKRKICDELDVVSYPAIRLYHQDGRMDRFRGPRTASEIVPFLRRALRPTISTLTDKNMTSFVGVDDVVFVAYLEKGDESLERRFLAQASGLRDRYSFAMGPPPEPGLRSTVACYNNREGDQRVHADFDGVGSLESFIEICAMPSIHEMNRRNELHLMQSGKSIVNYVFATDEDRELYVETMRQLAKKYTDYLVFTTINAEEYPDFGPNLGLGEGTGVSVMNPANGDVFPYLRAERISARSIDEFLIDIINGKVKPWGSEQEQQQVRNGGFQGRAAGSGKAASWTAHGTRMHGEL
ncbi:hypothetical protein MGG_08973 [Pyricularia oryzae 70-15]|uniref:Protein disulfide-isomerase n=1 Tax=Pyricularia oryzae (strain 70-15 / ATCC MYA-4617 / FGSC 8958) TaxID=242507 RepID=G4MW50_PYRO7|nr:uncharacterized protein MGG_08973 [Pyricularia oryzae 70-15]EHA54204.1 hypothetical protein MGG_08973 [Pyricularia oryzae 70-15]